MKINELCRRQLPDGDPNQIIEDHTFYPYYSPFLKSDQKQALIRKMLYGIGGQCVNIAGLSATNIHIKKELFLCPLCLMSDVNKYGEPYWHRIHHLPGVSMCAIHNTKLYSNCPHCNESLDKQGGRDLKITPLFCSNGHDLTKVKEVGEKELYEIALDSKKILQREININLEDINKNNQLFLKKLNYISSTHRALNLNKLKSEFSAKYTDDFLSQIGVPSPFQSKTESWLRTLTRKMYSQSMHPLYHILLFRFFCGDSARFCNNSHSYSPFGYGPWPCLNVSCNNYLKLSI